MLGLSAVVAIAASGAAIFVVFSTVAIVVWVRFRKERHALRVLRLSQGQNTRSIQTFTGDTLTELSHHEGTVLRAHGQLPYGKPSEWGQLESRETLLRPKTGSESSWPLVDKARSLRNSIRRTRSKRFSRSSHHKRMASMATVSEISPSPTSSTREDIPLSAVEGILELPAERTPRQTPEIPREEEGFHLGMRPMSPASAWPPPAAVQRDRSGLFPVLEDGVSQDLFDPPPRIFEESPTRMRGGSIASQTPGMAPEKPIPPPPAAAYPPDRISYLRNDSVMRLSSMSLDTTNSSILDDGRNGLRSIETDITSPNFPSGGTFVPYSANDVGVKNGRRSFIAANTSVPPMHNFPVRSSSTAEGRRKVSGGQMSPRRSMTTTSRNPSNASNRSSGFPRRSESLSSNPPQRHASLRSGTPLALGDSQNFHTHSRQSSSGSQVAYMSHFSQVQPPPMYEPEQRENDPFYGGSPHSNGTLFSIGSPGPSTSYAPQSPMQRSSLSLKGSLPSALKGGNSQRKGHRRQNCVRISIHPPMTFGSSTFSPTVEEETEDVDAMEEVDLRESAINRTNSLSSKPGSNSNTTSPLPLSKRGSRRTKPAISAPSSLGPLAEEPQSAYNSGPCKKRKHAPADTANSTPLLNKDQHLPGLLTSIPPTAEVNLSHTPSPERTMPVWSISEVPSPVYDNSPSNGSPRRTAVKGPRSQPGKPVRSNSTRVAEPKPMEPLSMELSNGLPFITGTQGSDWRKSTDSLRRTSTDASRSYRRTGDSQGSFASALGPVVSANSPIYSTKSSTVRDRVTIWEDANRSASPPKLPHARLQGYNFPETATSPTNVKNSIPRSLSKNGTRSPMRMSSQRGPTTPTTARRGMTTPTGKGLGIGVGITTPASLYDGDGFLRE
ncbi:hypothetical protein N7462_003284 [Penicillium macrosclerotiorum]|uniref:uncharacterized protein n=1 Tax=Penicillium macrosclerotiorum TaxID=303699 RepID=UPI00254957C5|nr:uncharacterized protein N7462_003284 [Penicillium macrosclerotiorum]KAJ5688892.1 hypothetical protein N7462_003284 [Penicillium macrosclerotiorum]